MNFHTVTCEEHFEDEETLRLQVSLQHFLDWTSTTVFLDQKVCYNTQKTQSSDGYATAATTAAVSDSGGFNNGCKDNFCDNSGGYGNCCDDSGENDHCCNHSANYNSGGYDNGCRPRPHWAPVSSGCGGLHVDSGGDDNCQHWHVQGTFLIGETSVLRDLQRSQAHLVLAPYWQEHCAGGAPRAAHVSANVHGTFNETHQTSSIKYHTMHQNIIHAPLVLQNLKCQKKRN